ncbi:MATE family efflux transporter [Oceanibacterium hippocampi]|uniref:Multidrug efflux protein n=1 Tax=Oceanibacterium hippocampi TaxID=745714 RepID=A0A1Y5TTM1_9PROT|nr:MATE family efflux transporter [Oceanibacterium hippocampi]SLN69389.1 multidrug efflux protein [Oceanibacterium hippocampi]
MKQSTDWILTAPIGATLARLAAPNVVAMVFMFATSMAEAWYVGHLGTPALAGLALAFPMFMLTTMLSAGAVGGAIAGAVAQRLGGGDREGAETLAFHAILVAVFLAAASAALFIGAGRPIYVVLGGTGAALEQALAYSDMFFAGCVAVWLSNSLSSIIRATGRMRIAATAMMTAASIQVVVSGLLVFGIGPLPVLGIAGAAIGAVVGYGIAALFQIVYLAKACPEITLRAHGQTIAFRHFASLLRVGLLASISPLSSIATVVVTTGLVSRLGEEALAGYGIGARLEFLMIPLIFGIGAALIMMVGGHFGAGAIARGKRIAWTGAFGAAAITGAIGIILALHPGLWANLFSQSEAVRAACATYLRMVGPFYAFFGLGLALYFASQGARRVFWPVVASVLRLGVVFAGGLYLFADAAPQLEWLFALVAAAMAAYGVATAIAIRFAGWGRGHAPSPAGAPAGHRTA